MVREEGRKQRAFEGGSCKARLAQACRSVELANSVQLGAMESFENRLDVLRIIYHKG